MFDQVYTSLSLSLSRERERYSCTMEHGTAELEYFVFERLHMYWRTLRVHPVS